MGLEPFVPSPGLAPFATRTIAGIEVKPVARPMAKLMLVLFVMVIAPVLPPAPPWRPGRPGL